MSRGYILLGRAGDILSFLPVLYDEAQRGGKPRLMVAEEYSSVLDGVSYVEPVIFKGPHYEIRKAVEFGREVGGEWICCQINGPADEVLECSYKPAGAVGARTGSYQKEEWLLAGKLSLWDNNLPLVIDRRNPEREAALVAAMPGPPKAKKACSQPILVSLGGNSSPFPYRDLLMELLRLKFGKSYAIVDLSKIAAERIYDLLGLYERAFCLIATDSAPLHLARAVPALPVLALTNDRPLLWNGSAWQPQHWFYCRYQDFPMRALELLNTVSTRWDGRSEIVHVWNAYDGRRPSRVIGRPCPIHRGQCGRDSQMVMPEEKRIPFLRDCIRMGMQLAGDDGWVMITQPDTEFADDLAPKAADATFAYRIYKDDTRLNFFPVVDMFCARKSWWKSRVRSLPDFYFGDDPFWPNSLWGMFRNEGAKDVTGAVFCVHKD